MKEKMKIGVITWFKYENYGTVLQALAFQKYLKNKEVDVELINFELNNNEVKSKNIKIDILKRIVSKIICKYNKYKYKSLFENKSKKFKDIINKNCRVSKVINNKNEYIKKCNEYDIIFFGSDQIWNPNWYHPFYYANYNEIKTKLVSYAPSFGVSELTDNIENIKRAISRFSYISVREEEGKQIIKKLNGKEVPIVCDPTLLLSCEEWTKMEEKTVNNYNDYILCYMLSDNSNHWKAIKKLAKKEKKKLVIIPIGGVSYIQSKYIVRDCSIGNFLYLIKNADYIVTDSFHGTVFSILYNKNFFTFERHNPKNKMSQNSRIHNLLNIAGAEACLIKYNCREIKEIHLNGEFYNNLGGLIKESKNYINSILGKEQII